MASSKWKTIDEIINIIGDRRVIFWGASNWIERTLDIVSLNGAYIVDNNPNNHGIVYSGFDVFPPSKLLDEEREEIYIVICTVNYQSVIDELHDMNYIMGNEFCCTPLLNFRKNKDNLKSIDRKIIISSPQHKITDVDGGGLYVVDTKSGLIEKKYNGKCRGVCYADELLLVIDMMQGIVVLDNEFNTIDCIKLQLNNEAHGLHYDKNNKQIYVGQAGRDSVAVYSMENRSFVKEIDISSKSRQEERDNHHINDLWVHGSSLFVSLFSITGNWMNDAYDGGVLEIDINTGEVIGAVVSNLWMPHSICRHNGQLCYVDSMRGYLLTSNWIKLGEFNSFVRGLDYDGKYYYIGASEHRYPEKLKNQSCNISLDAGFYIFDPDSKMSRFIIMNGIESVHSVLIMKY